MLFGTGGILQRGAEAFGRVHPQLRAQAVDEFHAGLGAALTKDARHAGLADKRLHDGRGIGRGREQIEVAHGGLHAPQTAAQGCVHDAGRLAQRGQHFQRRGQGRAQRRAAAAPTQRFQAGQDLGL